jgi:hypothetical protein
MEEEEIQEGKRGVRYPKVIDLISFDQTSDSVVVTMLEDRPWGDSEEQLDQLQDKFNNYVDYILDGWLYSQYPQYQTKKCVIRIQGTHPPDAQQAKFFEAMSRFCAEQNLGFEVV